MLCCCRAVHEQLQTESGLCTNVLQWLDAACYLLLFLTASTAAAICVAYSLDSDQRHKAFVVHRGCSASDSLDGVLTARVQACSTSTSK